MLNSSTHHTTLLNEFRDIFFKGCGMGPWLVLVSSCSELTTILWLPPSEVARENQEKVSSWMLTIFASGLQRRAYLTCGQDHTWSWQIGNKKLQLPGVFCLGCGLNFVAWIFSNPWTVFSLCTHIFFVWWIIWSRYYRLFGFTHQHIWL